MKNIQVNTVNAFAKYPRGGNPAGVVLNADELSEVEMQAIAKEVRFSETAFLTGSDVADYKIRFFTPKAEVDLCGHASLASGHALISERMADFGNVSLETKTGVLKLILESDGRIYLEQPKAVYGKMLHEKSSEIMNSLGLTEEDLNPELPIQIVSTGLRDILIPLKNREALAKINPNFESITQISEEHNVIGYHVFTLDAEEGVTAHCRNFAPLYDINEEAATGTSSGALASYLSRYGVSEFFFVQGEKMNRRSDLYGQLVFTDGEVTGVLVGGFCVSTGVIELEI
jgi:PhzF family phenazine biosynthesis protein